MYDRKPHFFSLYCSPGLCIYSIITIVLQFTQFRLGNVLFVTLLQLLNNPVHEHIYDIRRYV